jgi:hypothetical protein
MTIKVAVVTPTREDKIRARFEQKLKKLGAEIARVVTPVAAVGISFAEYDCALGVELNGAAGQFQTRWMTERVPFALTNAAGEKGWGDVQEMCRKCQMPKAPPSIPPVIPRTPPKVVEVEAAAEVVEVEAEAEPTTAIIQWNYKGTMIGLDGDEFIDMTAMWRANGGPENRRPVDYLKTDDAKRLIEQLHRENPIVAPGHLWKTTRGSPALGGGTHGFWKLALDYGMYLNVEFHSWCLDTIKAHIEGKTVRVDDDESLTAALARLTEQKLKRLSARQAEQEAKQAALEAQQEADRAAQAKALEDEKRARKEAEAALAAKLEAEREADCKAQEEREKAAEVKRLRDAAKLAESLEDRLRGVEIGNPMGPKEMEQPKLVGGVIGEYGAACLFGDMKRFAARCALRVAPKNMDAPQWRATLLWCYALTQCWSREATGARGLMPLFTEEVASKVQDALSQKLEDRIVKHVKGKTPPKTHMGNQKGATFIGFFD